MLFDIPAQLNGVDDIRVGGGTSHAIRFQGLDQGCLAIACRRLREALFLLELNERAGRVFRQLGQYAREVVQLVFLPDVLHVVDGQISGKEGFARGCAESRHDAWLGLAWKHEGCQVPSLGFDLYRVVDLFGGSHLAGDESIPDETIELELLRRQGVGDGVGSVGDIGRTDGLVGLLGALAGTVAVGRRGHEGLAIRVVDELARVVLGFLRDIHRVRSHVGDQSDEISVAQVNAFKQLLRNLHGAFRRVVQEAAGGLLESAGDKGRIRTLDARRAGDARNPVVHPLALQCGSQCVGELSRGYFRLGAIQAGQVRLQFGRRGVLGAENGIEIPVFDRLEGLDFTLAFHNQPQGDGLDSAGAGGLLHRMAEQWTDLVAEQAVQNAAGLLGIHQRLLDLAGVLEGVLDCILRDFMIGDSVEGPLGIVAKVVLEMPGNGLAFAVRVGGQVDFIRLLGLGAQFADDVLPLGGQHIVRLEIMGEVHAEVFAVRQVADMANGGFHGDPRPQQLADGLGFRDGLDNHQWVLCHGSG